MTRGVVFIDKKTLRIATSRDNASHIYFIYMTLHVFITSLLLLNFLKERLSQTRPPTRRSRWTRDKNGGKLVSNCLMNRFCVPQQIQSSDTSSRWMQRQRKVHDRLIFIPISLSPHLPRGKQIGFPRHLHGNFRSPHRQPQPEALKVTSKAKAYTWPCTSLA